MGKSVFLTGGCGFIGSHLAEAYVKEGYRVIVADNLSSGRIENLDGIKDNSNLVIYNIDIRDQEKLFEIIDKHRPTLINHHAAQKSVPYSVENPIYDVTENLIGLLNLILACQKFPIDNFIYISSGGALSKEIIGDDQSKESDIPQLESPYAITKYAGENYIKIYSNLFNFQYTVLRYGNVYGPRQIKDGECGVIPIFVENAINNVSSILMTYDDMPKGCTRDYVNVSDVVVANILATNKPINDIVNISSAKEVCILDIYNCIQEVFGTSVAISKQGPRLGDVRRSVLNNEKAKKILDWEPRTNLMDGLRNLKNFYS